MKPKLRSLIYLVGFLLLASIVFYIMDAGQALQAPAVAGEHAVAKQDFYHSIAGAFTHPLAIFILQIIVIIIASRLCGYLFRKIGQPAVMGEIIAGILLGPSLLGGVMPQFTEFVFPQGSLGNVRLLSQVGLILFMFVIGMELDVSIMRQKAKTAVSISNAGIVIPYVFGIALSYFLYQNYAPVNIPFYEFALFMGIALSITAFPVLARIIRERNLGNTRLGTIAMTSAAIGDVTGWCILAFIIAIAKAEAAERSLFIILSVLLYVAIMLFIIRPLLKRLMKNSTEIIQQSKMAVIFLVLLFSSYCAEVIGIHALFGAFLAGIIIPQDMKLRHTLINKIEDVALVLLLPLFFVATGLRTEIGLLNTPQLWMVCLVVIAVAVIGKLGGSALAAKLSGESVKDSLSIGALMNSRGLMELIVLNIGYDMGILSPSIFTIMVIMAIVTTMMTGPLLDLINRKYR